MLQYFQMKPLVAVFAHPDDEAFGPAGTLALEAKKCDVYLICVTNGAAGKNSSRSKKNLAEIRKKELKASAKILGIKKIFFLNYEDGTLCNKIYHELAEKIEEKLKELKPDTIITFEPCGISGHIDHIAVSLITTFVFKRLKFINTLLYHCVDKREGDEFGDSYFIYFPPGYKRSQIDKTVDVSSVWDTKTQAMFAHKSQKHDAEMILKFRASRPKEEYFLVEGKRH